MIGYPWLAKNYSGAVYAYEYKPNKSNSGYWQIDIEGRFRVLPSLCICKLVSSSDPEPYDIGKALNIKN